ncbi:MAG: cobalt ECF transporter T component CbiQ [Chloroflexi bacterium]|nr:cobalt ECF transporter T component CbiQ [Chloroflexota bacterium]
MLRLTLRRRDFVGRSLSGMTGVLERALYSEEEARQPGLLQSMDPRVKIVAVLLLILTAALAHHLITVGVVYGLVLLLAYFSNLSLSSFAKRGWLGITLFSAAVFVPALFLLPGHPLLVLLEGPPIRLAITDASLYSAALFVGRVGTSVSLALLLVSTTRWADQLRGMGRLRVPEVFVVVLGMTYRYIFLLLRAASNLFLARASRTVSATSGAEQRRWAGSAVGVLVKRSVKLSADVHLAMQARGFSGTIRTLDEYIMRDEDWLMLFLTAFAVAGLILLDGRLPWG